MVDWSGLGGWGDSRREVERTEGGGNESERKIEDWRGVGRRETGEEAPESSFPVTSLALVPGCAALRSRLSRNHPPTLKTRATAVRYGDFFYSGLVLRFHAACLVPTTSELFYALCAKSKG